MHKKLMPLLLAFSVLLSCLPAAQALTGDAERIGETLTALGLVNGTPEGNALSAPAAQEQGVVLLVRMLGETAAAQSDTRHCGWVRMASWASAEINYAAYHGLLRPQEYRPGETLSADLWCAMLLRSLGYSEEAGDFSVQTAMLTAQRLGLLSHALPQQLDRTALLESAFEALRFPYHDSGETMLSRLTARGLVKEGLIDALGLGEHPLTAREVYDRLGSAVFCLELFYPPDEDEDEDEDDGEMDGEEAPAEESEVGEDDPDANASGFFISQDGLALTNYHSIRNAERGVATLANGERYELSRVIFYDRDIDIAVIRLSQTSLSGVTAKQFPYIDLCGTRELRTGDTVFAIGNPLGLGLAISQGVVSALERESSLSSLPCVLSDATISQGSSGGALLNVRGQAIAVTAGAYTFGNNMYLGVPVDPILPLDLSQEGLTLREVLDEVQALEDAEENEQASQDNNS